MADAQWLADLGAHGLLRPSFIPPKEIRELRAVSRYRTRMLLTRSAARNRTIRLLEIAGIKLSSVVSDCFGVTGRRILDALTKPGAPKISELAVGSLRDKVALLEQSIGRGLMTEQQRELLRMHLSAYDALDAQVAELEGKLGELAQPYQATLERLDQIPGVNMLSAITVLAEIGLDMKAYRSPAHLTVLAGVVPGNAISDTKRRRISARKGNVHLRRILVQIAWAASNKKDSFLRSRFVRLQARIGRNKAIVALARQILIIIFHVVNGMPYKDLGATYYDGRQKERATKNYVRRLQSLGYRVEIKKLQ